MRHLYLAGAGHDTGEGGRAGHGGGGWRAQGATPTVVFPGESRRSRHVTQDHRLPGVLLIDQPQVEGNHGHGVPGYELEVDRDVVPVPISPGAVGVAVDAPVVATDGEGGGLDESAATDADATDDEVPLGDVVRDLERVSPPGPRRLQAARRRRPCSWPFRWRHGRSIVMGMAAVARWVVGLGD
jgi:hypothetical protein